MKKIQKKNLQINTQKLKINSENKSQKLKRFKRKFTKKKKTEKSIRKKRQDPEDLREK
jgi:hypothetical protein